MSFTTFDFILFLAIVLAAYHAAGAARLKGGVQWGWLAIASLFFYGYDNPRLLWLLGFSIVFNCAAGWRIAREVVAGRTVSRGFMAMALTVNLLLILSFKYTALIAGFFLNADDPRLLALQQNPLPIGISWHSVSSGSNAGSNGQQILIPIGISFYTFHAISFLVDLSRAGTREKEKSLLPFCRELAGGALLTGLGKLALYINFFPQLISGPIMKARDFMPQIGPRHPSKIAWRQAARYLIVGYFLKLFVADNLEEHTNAINSDMMPTLGKFDLLLLLYGYSFRIFADFAGYSLIALGLAGLFGYRLPINFNFPYVSASITEFWRRWHISLSNWLRDYLYFPLGGNRKGSARTYLNLFLVMFLGGLWHGASMRYAWWGVGHGVLLMAERALGVTAEETSFRNASIRKWLGMFLTFNLVSWLWLLFVMRDMDQVGKFFHALIHNPATANAREAFALCLYSLPVIAYHAWGYVRPAWRGKFSQSLSGGWLESAAYGFMMYFIITNPGASGNFIYFQF